MNHKYQICAAVKVIKWECLKWRTEKPEETRDDGAH